MKLRNLIWITAIIVILLLFVIYFFAPSILEFDWMNAGKPSADLTIEKFRDEPEELIRASIDAYASKDRLLELNELSLENTIVIYGQNENKVNGNSIEHYRFPDMVRVDFSVYSEEIIHLYDGLAAWTITGGTKKKASDYLAEGLRRNIKHFPGILLPSALDERSELGRTVVDSLDDKRVFTLEVTDWEGDQSKIWFDTETLLMIRIDYILFTSLGADTMSLVMSDYKDVDGIQIAHKALFYYNGNKAQETTVEKARYNPGLPDSLFIVK